MLIVILFVVVGGLALGLFILNRDARRLPDDVRASQSYRGEDQ